MPNKTSKSDVEINFHFENQEIIPLYFTKECDFNSSYESFFDIIYTIYWVILFLLMFSVTYLIYYYIKSNNYSIMDFVAIVINSFWNIVERIKVRERK